MALTLNDIADRIVRKAQRQGYVVPRDIRSELKLADLAEDRWKEVVDLVRDHLNYRQGRYYHVAAVSPLLHQEEERRRKVRQIVRRLIKDHKAAGRKQDRRGEPRVDFIQPVRVRTEGGDEFTLVSRDLSATGIRLLGTRQLLGQKIQVRMAGAQEGETLVVRVLWTCAVGEDLFENGGSFLDVLE